MTIWCKNSLTLIGPKDVLAEIASTGLSLTKLVPYSQEVGRNQDNLQEWCVKNWGTKWDLMVQAEDLVVHEFERQDQTTQFYMTVYFESVLAPPVEAIKVIFERYKDRGLCTSHEYFDKNNALIGTATGNSDGFHDQYFKYKSSKGLQKAVTALDHSLGEEELECDLMEEILRQMGRANISSKKGKSVRTAHA